MEKKFHVLFNFARQRYTFSHNDAIPLHMAGLKNILFDLGGVLIHLHTAHTYAAFCALAGSRTAYAKAKQQWEAQNLFNDLETGAISERIFLEGLRTGFPHPVTDEQLIMAWNAMLHDIPAGGLSLLEELKAAGYGVYLLSNTNSIHLADFRRIVLEQHEVTDFDALFDGAYYSHLIGARKPHAEAFQRVTDLAGIEPSETLFIDDNAPNLVGARAIGMHTLIHPANTDIAAHLRLFLQF